MNISTSFWLPILTMTIMSCKLIKSGETEISGGRNRHEGPELVGRIASIPAGNRFVLIQSYGNWDIKTGTILTTLGLNDRTANLLVTGEKLGQFAAADIQSGSLEIGDAVYSQHAPDPARGLDNVGAVSELPEHQEEVKTGNVQKNN